MSPDEKRARRRERDRAAYARDPEKFRELARENRLKAGAAERHKEYAKAWALRNAEHVKALRKANYEKDRQTNIAKTRAWAKRNPAKVLANQRANATINREKNRAARKAWEERNPTAALESLKRYRERNRAKIRARLTVSKQGRVVSGLHVETNLRVVEHHENARKHNAWESPGWHRPGDEAAPVAVPRQGSLF